jgi:succinylglutamic semialdehyde dehydrogenase
MSTLKSYNPATDALIWEKQKSDKKAVDAAVTSAREAFESFSSLSFDERAGFLKKWQEVLKENLEVYAKAISEDTGKTLWETRSEVNIMIGKVDISIEAYHERTGVSERETPLGRATLCHKPHGVIAVFGPFNFPGHIPNGHIVPALLAGNTLVFKPSELTPYAGEMMCELWEKTGLPKGVLNLVQGGVETGKALSTHSGIDGLFFTGSSHVGRLLAEAFGKTPEKILALELGGNNPLVIDEVADLEAAAYATIQSAFVTSGQRCTCARRLILTENQPYLDKLVEMAKKIQVGPYTDTPEPFYGPLISKESAERVFARFNELKKQGAEVLLEMEQKGPALLTPGIVDVTNLRTEDEECFGPLLQVTRVPNFEEAIIAANNTRYGLTAAILTDNKEKWERFLQKSRAGVVNWNSQTTGATSAAPFGGTGWSGNLRPSAYYAADYCAYPVASMQNEKTTMPEKLAPGISVSGGA